MKVTAIALSAGCRPAVAQGNAVLMEFVSVTELCGLEGKKRFSDVSLSFQQSVSQQGRICGGFGRRASRMPSDHEGGVSKQADSAAKGARHADIDNFLDES